MQNWASRGPSSWTYTALLHSLVHSAGRTLRILPAETAGLSNDARVSSGGEGRTQHSSQPKYSMLAWQGVRPREGTLPRQTDTRHLAWERGACASPPSSWCAARFIHK